MFGIRLCQKTSTPCEPKRTPSGLETDVLTGGFATLLLSGSLETDVLTGGFATFLFFVFLSWLCCAFAHRRFCNAPFVCSAGNRRPHRRFCNAPFGCFGFIASDETLIQNGHAMGASAMTTMMMTLFLPHCRQQLTGRVSHMQPHVGYGARFCNAGLHTAEAGSRRAHRRFQNM